MHAHDVRVLELRQRSLLHVDLVVHVLVPPFQSVHLGFLDHLQSKHLPRTPVLRLEETNKTNQSRQHDARFHGTVVTLHLFMRSGRVCPVCALCSPFQCREIEMTTSKEFLRA